MSKTRNLSDLLDANGDVKSTALDNVPASNDASALTTGTLDNARLPSSIDISGTLTANGVSLGDNEYLNIGASNDLQISHQGTETYINEQGTGSLNILSNGTGIFLKKGVVEDMAKFNTDGAVELYYDNSKKLETTSSGATVTGTLTADGVSLGDNEKAQFGASNDLQIFHDGSNSYIKDEGAGELKITTNGTAIQFQKGVSEIIARFVPDGNNELYYDNSKKFETTSGGATVTGTLTADGISLGDNETINVGASNDLQIYHDGAASFIKDSGAGSLTLLGGNFRVNNVANTQQMIAANDGGAAELYYGGSKKLETTSGGINVTGAITVNGSPLGGETAFAYVNFNGTGTVSIRGSYNVSSITDHQTGDYSVNFSSSASNSTYTAVGTGGDPSQDGEPFWTQAISTSAWRGWLKVPNAGRNDRQYVMATIHGG